MVMSLRIWNDNYKRLQKNKKLEKEIENLKQTRDQLEKQLETTKLVTKKLEQKLEKTKRVTKELEKHFEKSKIYNERVIRMKELNFHFKPIQTKYTRKDTNQLGWEKQGVLEEIKGLIYNIFREQE